MPWNPASFGGGIAWADNQAPALDAANLNLEESEEAAYAVQIGQSVVDYFESGSSASVAAIRLASDLLGRIGVLSASNDPAPATAVTVSVLDAPFRAKGDAKVVTDGSITSGTNQLSSATATWVNGQRVVVQAAGPNTNPGGIATGGVPGVLVGYVNGIAGSVASLVTTLGGSTPANASATISSGATVKYGTDDTAAFQAAINAMSTAASTIAVGGTVGRVKGADGRAFMVGNLTPKSNVLLDLYGSTMHLATDNQLASTRTPMFQNALNTSFSNWHLRGGTFPGTGTEAGGSGTQSVMRFGSGDFGGNLTATFTDISVKDVIVTNWATAAFDIRGGSRLRFSDNTFKSCSTATGGNTINVIMAGGTTVASSDVFIQNNYFDNNPSECIAIGEAFATTSTFDRAIITGNICHTNNNACPIDIEWSTATTGTAKTVIIAFNIIRNTGSGSSAYCIAANDIANTPPLTESRIIIALNNCDSTAKGILCTASDALVALNFVYAAQGFGIELGQYNAFSITADTNSSTSLTNVVASASIVNGSPITGTGIQLGTYLVSGAGTATWIISLPATTTTAANALSVKSQAYRITCTLNHIRAPSTMTINPIQAHQMRNSAIVRNNIMVDPGSTGAGSVALCGIFANYCGWCEFDDNKVSYAPGGGIQLDSCNDTPVRRNRIYNPSELGVNISHGIIFTNISGSPFRVQDNICVDDRAVHQMQYGIYAGATNGLAELLGNEIRGATTAPVTPPLTQFAIIKNNITDVNTWPAATSAATLPATGVASAALPYPTVVYLFGGTATNVQIVRAGSSTRNVWTGAGVAIPSVMLMLAAGDQYIVFYTVAPTGVVQPLQI